MQSSFFAELPLSASVFVCVAVCVRASSVCLHVFGGKVKAGKATCRSDTWDVVAKVIGLFVYTFSFPSPLLKQNTESPTPRCEITN